MSPVDIVKRIQAEVAAGGPQSSGDLLERLGDESIASDTLAVAIGVGLERGVLQLTDTYLVDSTAG